MEMAGNFFLVGLMGSGKTTIGKLLAKRLGKQFYDSDHEVEAKTGVSIPTIFDIEGEAGFRDRETQALEDLTVQQGIVLATGGGAVIRPENRRMLQANGVVIYLCAHVDDLLARTQHDKNRPLLQTADPRAKLESLYLQRDPLYREVADIIINTSQQNVNQLLHELEQRLSHFHKPTP